MNGTTSVAQAGVLAAVLVEVDERGGAGHAGEDGGLHGGRAAHQGHHGAVMVAVGAHVEDAHIVATSAFHGRHDGGHHLRPPRFRKIGHAFNERA
jgi:hypothetical protein